MDADLAYMDTPPVIVAGDSGSRWGELVIRRATELARAGMRSCWWCMSRPLTASRTRQAWTWTGTGS